MSTPTHDQERILQDTQSWSIEEQLELVQTILQRVTHLRGQEQERRTQQPQSQRVPSAALRGLLANGQPTPSDEDVARWLEEARIQKYGG